MMAKVVEVAILDDYQGTSLTLAPWNALPAGVRVRAFQDTLHDEAALAHRLLPFNIVVAMRERTSFNRSIFERLPNLKLLVTTGMRNAAIDLAAAAANRVTVCGTDLLGYPTAELTWGLIIALARNIPRESRSMLDGAWQTTLGITLRGKTLSVLGLGRLGSEVAAIGKAFQMNVIGWSPNLTSERANTLGVRFVTKSELFRAADFLSIHLVLGDRSRGLVGATELSLMKHSAFLVNTSRGPIIDERALVAALEARAIAGAALDVFNEEPLPAHHRLRQLPNALLTPHLGYVTKENFHLAYGQAIEDIAAFLSGAPIRVLNA
jgi:phosphoglycerate dehydrogenase-like enzyme